MPYYFKNKTRKKQNFKLWKLVLSVVLIAVIVIIVLSVTIKPKSNTYLTDIKMYFVYTDKNTKQNALTHQQDIIESLGGSGQIMFYKEQFYLIANVYFSEADAEEICQNIKPSFSNSGVLSVTKTLSKKQKRAILENDSALECFKIFSGFANEVQDMSMKYIVGSLSESSLCNKVLSKKLELENIIKKVERDDSELSKKILTYENLCLLHMDKFFDNFFESNKKQSILAKLVVSLVLSQCELYDNL